MISLDRLLNASPSCSQTGRSWKSHQLVMDFCCALFCLVSIVADVIRVGRNIIIDQISNCYVNKLENRDTCNTQCFNKLYHDLTLEVQRLLLDTTYLRHPLRSYAVRLSYSILVGRRLYRRELNTGDRVYTMLRQGLGTTASAKAPPQPCAELVYKPCAETLPGESGLRRLLPCILSPATTASLHRDWKQHLSILGL